ncbi:hypothetical protein PQR33_36100 [Paraburkholderia sediminicola]|uniref:hypothetical protein n=1 Tax=Paraburkholderia sediminicola TaxID=458836 RepID=UPI0038BD0D5C
MKEFFLICPDRRTEIPADLLEQLRALPDIRVVRVMTGIVRVQFAGSSAALAARLVATAWSSSRISESRTYRLQ